VTLNDPSTEEQLTKEAGRLLGHIQRQSASELYSAGRAILTPSAITRALSSKKARMAARSIMALGVDEAAANYVAFRVVGSNTLIRRLLPENQPAVVVDPIVGFSPQHIWLTQELPDVVCIEVDLPKNIQEKKRRLRQFDLPSNLKFVEADLALTPLHEAIGDMKADVVIANAAYVDSTRFVTILKYLRHILKPNGKVIAEFPYAPGSDNLAKDKFIMRRLAGNPVGIVQSVGAIYDIFRKAEYTDVEVVRLSELAAEVNHPTPADIEVFAVACNNA
jgi:SAM-dependent methyltransferase